MSTESIEAPATPDVAPPLGGDGPSGAWSGRAPAAPFSPRELADLLLEAGGAEIRAAFACGLVTGWVPIVLFALRSEALDRPDRIAYSVAAGLLLLAFLAGLATFLDGLTAHVAGFVGSVLRGGGRHTRRLIGRGARRAITWSLVPSPDQSVRARLTTPHGMMAVEAVATPASRGRAITIRTGTSVARWANRSRPEAPLASVRERRVFAKSVAAQCATVFALLGVVTALVGWIW